MPDKMPNPLGRYAHPEAFCLMKYASKDGRTVEWIWNSRDGVTPFIVSSKDGVEMSHVSWNQDRRLPGYQPSAGERVFVDVTEEAARARAEEVVARRWHDPKAALSHFYADQEEAILAMVHDWLAMGPGAPILISGAEYLAGRS